MTQPKKPQTKTPPPCEVEAAADKRRKALKKGPPDES